MIRWCSYCQRFLGETPPFDDLAITHGLCDECERSGEALAESMERGRRIRDFLLNATAEMFSRKTPEQSALLRESRALGVRDLDLLVGLFQPVLYQVGRLFEAGEITVDREHEISALAEAVLDVIGPTRPAGPGKSPMLLVSAPGNVHTIGPRIYAEQQAQAGEFCDVLLKATEEQVLARLEAGGHRRLGISVALPWQLERAHELAALVQQRFPGTQVVLGGFALKTACGAA